MASPIIVLAGASPQLGSTYGVYLISVIAAAALHGFTILQSLYYYQEFPKDKSILKLTVGVLWALDTLTIFLDSHATYFYLISNFTNTSALNQEVWSVQAELLVTYTVVLIVQVFFILRMYHLRPHLWYIPIFFGLLAIASYGSLVAIFVRVQLDGAWQNTASPGVTSPIIANWLLGNVVDIGITVVLCWYLWSEKAGVPRRTNVMLNRIIVFLVNRGAIAAVFQVMTLLAKFIFPQTFVWFAFHNMLSKVYANSMLASLNARVGFRKIITDYQLGQTKPPTQFSVRASRPMTKAPPLYDRHQISTVEFADPLTYPPAALDNRSQWSTHAAYDSPSTGTGTGTGSSTYDQQSGLASFHEPPILSQADLDQSGGTTDWTAYPRYVNRAASAGSRHP